MPDGEDGSLPQRANKKSELWNIWAGPALALMCEYKFKTALIVWLQAYQLITVTKMQISGGSLAHLKKRVTMCHGGMMQRFGFDSDPGIWCVSSPKL